jgi:methionine-gamma-lyase
LVFASGLGALTTTLLALASGGEHIVAQRSKYGGALSLVQNLLPRFGVTCTLVDQADTGA